jgi:lysophospholipase
MKLVSIPANPVPDDAVTGMLKTPDGVPPRFVRFAPPVGTHEMR